VQSLPGLVGPALKVHKERTNLYLGVETPWQGHSKDAKKFTFLCPVGVGYNISNI